MILFEKLKKLIKVAPLHFVIVGNCVRLACLLAQEVLTCDQENEKGNGKNPCLSYGFVSFIS